MSREIENIERLINNKKAQFRDFQITNIEIREATEGEPEKLIIRGVPCVFNQETLLFRWDNYMVYEQVDEGAFDEADMSDVIFNCNHGGRVFARTRNNSLKLTVNKKQKRLEMETELWDDDEGHRQLYRDIKRGNIDKMSFAFTIKSQERTTEELKENDIVVYKVHRKITGIDRLFDVSAVDIPAYDATEISARRMFDAESKEQEAESRKAVSLALAKYNYIKERNRQK